MCVDIIVFGSAIMDFICYAPSLPKPGETLHGHKFQTGFGGKGANQCVAATRLGATTALIAKLGNDKSGDDYLKKLKEEGVNTDYIKQVENETTGIAQIAVSDAGENHIIIVAGANNSLSSEDFHNAKKLLLCAKVLICQLETPVDATIEVLRNFNGISILNAAPALANMPKELLELSTILCVNETEAILAAGRTCEIQSLNGARAVINDLIKKGANTVVITLGPRGAVYVTKGAPKTCIHVPAPNVEEVLDTTGAGDAFIGALAFYLMRYPNKAFHQVIGAACAIASYSVQHLGTQSSFPTGPQCAVQLDDHNYEWSVIE